MAHYGLQAGLRRSPTHPRNACPLPHASFCLRL
jgi:hypothetical protein